MEYKGSTGKSEWALVLQGAQSLVKLYTLTVPSQSPNWDSRIPLISPQKRGHWLPEAYSGPAPTCGSPLS